MFKLPTNLKTHSLIPTLSIDSYTVDQDLIKNAIMERSLIICTHTGATYKRGLDERICPHYFALKNLKNFSIVTDNSRDALYYRFQENLAKWQSNTGINLTVLNFTFQLIMIVAIICYPLVTTIPLLIGKFGLGQNVQYINVNEGNSVEKIIKRLKNESVLVYLTQYTKGRGLYHIIKQTKCPIYFIQIYEKDSGDYALSSRIFKRNEISMELTPQEFMKRLKECLYQKDVSLFE